jgi:hypothetical protein
LAGVADSSCSVWSCVSDVWVTWIDLKCANEKEPPLDRPRDGSFTRNASKTAVDYALVRLIHR